MKGVGTNQSFVSELDIVIFCIFSINCLLYTSVLFEILTLITEDQLVFVLTLYWYSI